MCADYFKIGRQAGMAGALRWIASGNAAAADIGLVSLYANIFAKSSAIEFLQARAASFGEVQELAIADDEADRTAFERGFADGLRFVAKSEWRCLQQVSEPKVLPSRKGNAAPA